MGVASSENVLRQLENILNEGYEVWAGRYFHLRAGRQLDQAVRNPLTRGLIEYIHGPESPTSGDELTFFITREVMREFGARLILVNFGTWMCPIGAPYSLYLQAITRTDRLVGMLWDEVQSNPLYKDKIRFSWYPSWAGMAISTRRTDF